MQGIKPRSIDSVKNKMTEKWKDLKIIKAVGIKKSSLTEEKNSKIKRDKY